MSGSLKLKPFDNLYLNKLKMCDFSGDMVREEGRNDNKGRQNAYPVRV
ncbi:hypothetical protein B6N60_02618 [Richelia sinica FACHB-800]|uniref:Uncharacterized protein n=1 Tax=Richelia sinica FACHB-800 TaxID=1357546 RepID=A0A975T9N0_9NOST|nr:hypothetical protein B6N60_02618 [Richelia sinica FACHB-800]